MASSERMTVVRFLGSIYFAAILLAILAILLSVSTWVESTYGTPFAQRLVYQAGWFDAFLLLLAVNILLSTLSRWPFKKKHTGFVMTHIGILMLLGGSLASRLLGVDGQLLLPENHDDDHITLSQYELVVAGDHGEEKGVLPIGRKGTRSFIPLPGTNAQIWIHRIADEIETGESVREGASTDAVNPAIKVSLQSQAMGANIETWIMQHHPFKDDPREAAAGPAKLRLLDHRPTPDTAAPSLHVKKDGRVLLHWKAGEDAAPGKLGNDGMKITGFHYYPDARVGEGGKLISSSEDPVNPAVEFTVEDDKGHQRRYLKFANFPEFESMHGRAETDPFDLEVTFHGGTRRTEGPSLVFFKDNGEWSFESRNRAGEIKAQGKVVIGQAQPAGWVDFQFTVEELYERAQISRTVRPKTGGQDGPAVDVSIRRGDRTLDRDWVLAHEIFTVPGEGSFSMTLRQTTSPVPFSLKLLDFRKVDYPGTNRPASFESDVQLTDPREKIEIKKTIRMNQPLDYAGYRIFQSSFIQNNGQEASVFTVAKNPGIFWIYFGSIVLFTGVFITFFIPKFSSFRR